MSSAEPLHETTVDRNPFRQFQRWFEDARASAAEHNFQAEAMTLATATPDGQPSARVVLLRGFDERGLVFFTNYEGRKGRELTINPRAAVVFFWDALDRQVRVEGRVERATAEESDTYFKGRPRGSQLGAWASPQSTVLQGRDEVNRQFAEIEARFAGQVAVPRPPNWGGFRIVPQVMEFWQGQRSRLHDRLRFVLQPDASWVLDRLAP